MNEKVFAIILAILAVAAVFLLPGAALPAAEIMVLKLIYVSFLLVVVYAVLHFTRGTTYDIQKEIFDESNLAGAVFVGAIILAIATVIAK